MPWVPTWGKLPVETTPLTDPSGVIVGGYTACGCFRVRKRRTAIIVMLCVIFWTIVSKDSSNVALESALPAFEKYDVGGMGSHLVAVLPGTAACFYALGKGSAAILSFWFGGRNVLAYVQCLFGALCVLIITTGEPTLVLLGAIGANFSSAHGWAATSHVIANWMHSNEVGRTYALFGLAGSGGSVLAAFAYGAILDVPPEGSQWRWMFFVAASCLLLGAILVFALLRSSSRAAGFAPPSQRDTKEGEERPHPLDDASLWLACGAFVRSPRCCLMISVCCGYAVSTGVVYAFLPLYAVDALGATEGNAARLLPWLLVGSCVGSVGMGIFRDYASERKVVVLTGLLNLLAAAAVLGWVLHETGVNRWLTMESLGPICFIIGASMEATWTIHVSVFQLRYGGGVHASTLCGLTDFLSFAFKAPFMFLVGSSFQQHKYGFPVSLVAGSMLIGHVLIMIVFLLDTNFDDMPPLTVAERNPRWRKTSKP